MWASVALAAGLVLVVRRRPAFALAGLVAAAAGAGGAAAALRHPGATAAADLARRVPSCVVGGVVLERAGALGTLVAVEVARCDGFAPVRRAGTVAVADSSAEPGAPVEARGWLVPLGDDPYDRARAALGAGAAFEPSDIESGPPAGLHAAAAAVRSALRSAARPHGRAGALLRGLAVGDTGGIDPATSESLRRAGLSHIVAVSGSNLAIVAGAVALVTRKLWLWARIGTGALAICAFVLVAGPEPSVLRAAAMGAVGLAALAGGHRARPGNALPVALIAVVGLRPGFVGAVGLHLSAAATAGIVLWARPIADRLSGLPSPVAAVLAVALAAQAAVAPVLVLSFGEFSVIAPVANLAAAPAVPAATVLGTAAGAAGALFAPAGSALAAAAAPLCAWIVAVGDRLGSLDAAVVEIPRGLGWPLAAAAAAAALRTVASRA